MAKDAKELNKVSENPDSPEHPCEPIEPPGEYRQWLIAAEQKAQDDFDKAVLSLSGGALGVSFIFVREIVGPGLIDSPMLLLGAWLSWAGSSLAILGSFYFSNLALGKAVRQCDDGTVYSQTPGGIYARITKILNATGAALFVLGVCLMAAFIFTNLIARNDRYGDQAPQPSPTTHAATDADTPASTGP